jgi:hypothetical protein
MPTTITFHLLPARCTCPTPVLQRVAWSSASARHQVCEPQCLPLALHSVLYSYKQRIRALHGRSSTQNQNRPGMLAVHCEVSCSGTCLQ